MLSPHGQTGRADGADCAKSVQKIHHSQQEGDGHTLIYIKMQKALYGLLRSALLFYNKLVANLESDGSVLNPHDSCVANKVVDRKQMTVCWHVDDLEVSHSDPAQVTIFREWLSRKYVVAVATYRGKVNDYLGMIFNFSAKGSTSRTSSRTSQRRS